MPDRDVMDRSILELKQRVGQIEARARFYAETGQVNLLEMEVAEIKGLAEDAAGRMPRWAIAKNLGMEGHIHRWTAEGAGLYHADYVVDANYTGLDGAEVVTATGSAAKKYKTIKAAVDAANTDALGDSTFLIIPGDYTEQNPITHSQNNRKYTFITERGYTGSKNTTITAANDDDLFKGSDGKHWAFRGIVLSTAFGHALIWGGYSTHAYDCRFVVNHANAIAIEPAWLSSNEPSLVAERCEFAGTGTGVGQSDAANQGRNLYFSHCTFRTAYGVAPGFGMNSFFFNSCRFDCTTMDVQTRAAPGDPAWATELYFSNCVLNKGVNLVDGVMQDLHWIGCTFNLGANETGLDFSANNDAQTGSYGVVALGCVFDGNNVATAAGIAGKADPNGGPRYSIFACNAFVNFTSGNEYQNLDHAGNIVAHNTSDAGGLVESGTDHAVLSALHTDTLAAAVVRGSVIVGNATPKWSALAGVQNAVLQYDGADTAWDATPLLDGLVLNDLDGTPVGDLLLKVMDQQLWVRTENDLGYAPLHALTLKVDTIDPLPGATTIDLYDLRVTQGVGGNGTQIQDMISASGRNYIDWNVDLGDANPALDIHNPASSGRVRIYAGEGGLVPVLTLARTGVNVDLWLPASNTLGLDANLRIMAGRVIDMQGNILHGHNAAWGTLILSPTSHASKGNIVLRGATRYYDDNVSDAIFNDAANNEKIRFDMATGRIQFTGNIEMLTGVWFGEQKLERFNSYDDALTVRGGSGEAQPRFMIRPGTTGAGAFTLAFGAGGATAVDTFISRKGVAQLSLQNALLIGADASPATGYALELRDDFLLGAYYQDLGEIATPANPAANRARLYSKDNGSGKTQLVALFPTGAEQVLATEP